MNGVIAIGPRPETLIEQLNAAAATDLILPQLPGPEIRSGQMLVWIFSESRYPLTVVLEAGKAELRRHKRKYATGELGEDKSFYFRGPKGKLKLRAQNLNLFTQLAEGVDDETWVYHLRNKDYSTWLRESVKDDVIADEIAIIEQDHDLGPAASREQVIAAIRRHYTGPA
jgi:hypothetical protein